MNKKLKAKWVAALLSEDFKQGCAALHADGKFCVLGVLRHVNNPDDVTKWTDPFGNTLEMLSIESLNECGLTNDIQRELAGLNDIDVPFPMLAGLIEETL